MIQRVTGDILLSGAQLIAHGVAPNDHFDRGLALALRERWPGMYRDFRHHCHQSHPKPGTLWLWSGAGAVRIACLLTQGEAPTEHARPGRATLANVNHCLRALRTLSEGEKLTSIALPRLATGVGGLPWPDVEPLIEKHLGDLAAKVFVYETYREGEKATEASA